MASAREIAGRIGRGEVSAQAVTRDHLAQIAARDPAVEAWTHLDPELALARSAVLDERLAADGPVGPLHGVCVGLKDIFDTADMPTGNGLAADAGRQAAADSTVARRLRDAGAVILGKTVTTEAAYFSPGKTKNPHDATRTPGGSSSGSAAAVAAGMVPLAIGSQTNGSMIRPASFCGVVGFKPSFGAIARTGALTLSAYLDHVGVFATSVDDAAMLTDCLTGPDGADGSAVGLPTPVAPQAAETLATAPAFALVKGPGWAVAEADLVDGFARLADALAGQVTEVAMPVAFDDVVARHQAVMAVEMARNLARYGGHGAPISDTLREQLEAGAVTAPADYEAAVAGQAAARASLDALLGDFDAIVTPAATGQAPRDLTQTGDPVFCTPWTYCGAPAISLPLLTGGDGMPIGVQLVGRWQDDCKLLQIANWLTAFWADAAGG